MSGRETRVQQEFELTAHERTDDRRREGNPAAEAMGRE